VARGALRVYLGAAPGVGKTYAMLNEGHRRRGRGADVVVGVVETHGRVHTIEQLGDLEVVPRRAVEYRGARLEEMDVDAVLERAPTVALVDELAHTNVPGSAHDKRWQDVEQLLEAGINVITTVNVQHLQSLNDVVLAITGVPQRETVPDRVVREAEQIELVDMSPESLRRRMAHGNIYRPGQIEAALSNYFRTGNLIALRELALLWLADRVDEGLQDYRERHGIASPWETRERVVVALTASAQGERLIRRAARVAARSHAELVGVHVRTDDGLARVGEDRLERYRSLLTETGGRFAEVTGRDPATTLVEFARAENATQLLLGATGRGRLGELVRGSIINEVLRQANGIDVHVLSPRPEVSDAGGPGAEASGRGGPLPRHRRPAGWARPPRRARRRLAPLPRRRLAAGAVLAGAGMPAAVAALAAARSALGPSGTLPELLLAVVVVAAVGGLYPAVAAALLGFGLGDWFLIPPVHSLTIGRLGDAVALGSFILTAVVVSLLLDRLARRTLEARQGRLTGLGLARLAGAALAGNSAAVGALLPEVRDALGVEGVSLLGPAAAGWQPLAAAGSPSAPGGAPASPAQARCAVELADGVVLAVGRPVPGGEPGTTQAEILSTFAARLQSAGIPHGGRGAP
jgi:two-component system sensor histidine kinase KdpD